MELIRSGSRPSAKGPAEYFTGNVRVDSLFQAADPSRVSASLVTFEPGARTAWHTHPLGQRLVVTSGCGWVQCQGGAKERNPRRRRGGVSARRETLARGDRDDRDEPYRHSRGAERQGRRLAGEGERREVAARAHKPVELRGCKGPGLHRYRQSSRRGAWKWL